MRLRVMLLTAVLGVLVWCSPAAAVAVADRGTVDEDCAPGKLAKGEATASIRLEHDNRVTTKVISRVVLKVPSAWPLARQLLLSEETEAYRRAMACLLRPYAPPQYRWWDEWRPSDPRVTPEKDGLRIRYDAYTWVDRFRNDIWVGPWQIEVGAAYWRIRFEPPDGLKRITWKTITGRSSGRVIWRKISRVCAPSTRAASYSSGLIDCRPARKIIIE